MVDSACPDADLGDSVSVNHKQIVPAVVDGSGGGDARDVVLLGVHGV